MPRNSQSPGRFSASLRSVQIPARRHAIRRRETVRPEDGPETRSGEVCNSFPSPQRPPATARTGREQERERNRLVKPDYRHSHVRSDKDGKDGFVMGGNDTVNA